MFTWLEELGVNISQLPDVDHVVYFPVGVGSQVLDFGRPVSAGEVADGVDRTVVSKQLLQLPELDFHQVEVDLRQLPDALDVGQLALLPEVVNQVSDFANRVDAAKVAEGAPVGEPNSCVFEFLRSEFGQEHVCWFVVCRLLVENVVLLPRQR